MECCDSVSDDGASGPYTNQPSGFCSPTSSLLHLPRDKTSHQSSATQCEPGLRRRVVENDAEVEGTTLGDVCERGVGAEQDDEYAVGDPSKKRGEIRERIDEEDEGIDEVECQIGEIVYQADGSAYVLQSQSELPRGVVPSSSHPPIINTCHYSSSQSSALKSFHVFHLHHPKNWCHLPGDIRALLSRQSKDRAPARTGLSEAEQVPFSRAKPILLCFLCRLSFKRVSAFRGHVSQQHSVTLSIEEQGLLSLQDTCAILQPVGSSHHPLLSFLEPKTSSVHAVSTQFATTTQGHNTAGMLSQEERENLQVSEPGLPFQPSLPRAPLPTSALSPAKDPSTLGREGTQRNNDNDLRKDDRSSREGEESLSSEVVCTAKDSVSGVSSSGRQEHVSEEALSNQSIPKSPNSVTLATSFMNNTKSLTDSELECGTSFNCHDPAPVSPSVQTSPTASTPKDLGNQETAMGTKPNDLSENGSAMTNEPNGRQCNDKLAYSDLPSSHNNSQSPVTQPIRSPLEDVQADAGSRGAFLGDGGLVGRDGMQGSSYSFGGQVIMTHSRNSCKTLKCPKCNWHYKYQQTLEAHMKEKHPDTEEGQCPYCSSGQSHPRLARGETYTCGYKPFRCQVCQYSTTTKGNLSIHMQSDKHLNNMQNLQTQTRPQAPISQPSPLPHTPPIQATTPSPSKIQGRASWRCEVCDYETNVARNLRIHMTSEKHTHNMLLLQQNLAHMQRQRRHNATELYRYCQAQSKLPDPSLILPPGDILQEPSQNQEDGDPPEGLFECVLCGRFFSDSLEALSQHLAAQRSLPDSEWRSSTGDAHHCRLCHYATPLRANFQLHCQTDKHLQRYQLAAHLQEASSNHGNSEEEDEWLLRCVAAGVQVQLRCNACNYEANSLEKLKLHTVSSRHEASLRLYKYLQQSEATMSDGVWLHCVLCDYSTQNSLSLVQHSNSLSHQRGEGLLRLQRIQKGLKDEEEELGAIFKIRKCPAQENGDVNEMESPTEITADQEEQTKHTDREGEETETSIYVEKRQSESCASPKRPLSASGDSDDSPPPKRPRAQEDISSEQVRQCPFCRFCHADIARLRSHVMIQHAVQPTLRCPLCQDTLRSVALLRTHLTHLHSVTADCTQKLINTVIASDVLPDKMFLPVQDASAQQMKADSSCNGMKTVDERSEDEQDRMATSQPEVSKNEKQPLEDAESTKENTAAFPCWQKGCNKVLTSSSALQTHVNHVHSQKPQNPISDRHVYKYRCSQCSLAFKTAEKLQLHSQYHAIRAATMCCLCHRNFRTLQALQKHLETSHLELSEAQLQQLCGSLLMTADLLGTEGLVEEQGTLEEERVKEDEESDVEEKVNPVESDVGLGREEVEANSKQAVIPHRKGPNLSTEKFLDPSRPFKCTVCKESFTQKNILLVHYNSVSHLHKVKRSVQDSSTGLPETVSSSTTTDHKPFKCSICNVAYSQSSTLEIHMRSVLHQTKARAAKLDSSGANPAPVNSMLGKAFSLTGNTAVNSPTASKSMTAMNSSGTSTLSLNHQQGTEDNVSSSQNSSHSSTSEEAKTKHLVDMMASTTKQQQKMLQQQQQQLVQAQAQIQQELQKKAALLQSHLFNPALLHHFPISTDALLPLQQQQQLLLPFLIPGGEFQINPELNVKSPGLNISTAKAVPSEDCSESAQQASLSSSSKQTLNRDVSHMPLQSLSVAPEKKLPVLQQANGQILTPDPESNKGMDLQSNNKATSEVDESASQDNMNNFKAQEDLDEEVSSSGEFFTVFIPPRVAHNAPGNVSKALLENIGFELVMHFNENKQQCQKTEVLPNEETMSNAKEEDDSEVKGKLECESCGKLFSNTLILKSHKEHIHQSIFPIQSLEKFAKDYRQQYDKQFPCRPPTPEASPSPPSPTTPPPLPQSAEATHQKPVSSIPVTAPTVTPPAVSTPQVPLAPIPLPIDLPLFPPLMMHPMPLQGLPPPLPVHLPSVETGLTPDLTQLYQHQLTPAMMQQQQQGKRPRTRITDDQLRILRQYFDINNSPNEDQIHEMANKSGLPQKVIKHWFRNTLFKERQRNKDSPYNFSNPPITTLEDVKVDSRPSSPEPLRHEYSGGRRSSRTRFSDYQLRALQDFFDANAYPKDDEFEQLSNLLNLSTRVIVVWFQNARQKARKNYENQEEGAKESEHREFSNDRYRRTSNNNYECKKCSTVFQRIFDLINHQKKVCYKDDDEELLGEQNDLFIDPKSYSPSEATPAPSCSSLSNDTEPPMDVKSTDKQQIDPEQPHQDATISDSLTEDIKQEIPCDPEPCPGDSKLNESNPAPKLSNKEMEQASATKFSSPTIQQSKKSNPSVTQPSPVPSQSSQKSFTSLASPSPQQHLKPSQPVTPYHCIQCKLSFPSFEHWQEHQQMHFLVAQNHFVAPQFLDHPVDIPLMLFDPSNPLLARQVLSGAFPQISASSPSVAAIPDSTINSLKRKLEQKSGNSSVENDWENNGDDSQRDKRMRTTITPEQLEVLYQKYLLDSNPTRQMLDHISQEVGLKKRVVQVWFQNTRARERKGQFRALGPVQAHRRCPFCRALFKAQTALDAHIRSRHWHEAKSAGYSMAIAGMTQDQEGSQFKMDPFNFSNCSQMPNPGDGLSCPESPTSKSLDLSSHQQRLSPKPLKSGGLNDFEGSLTAQETFERSKDNYEVASMNLAHNGTMTHEENYSAEGKPNSIDQLSCSSEREASSENEDKISSGLVSPAMSFSAKDFENDLVLDYSENSSLADPASPCPGGSHSQSFEIDKHGHKRYRTQLNNLQVKVLKACFSDYKTPTMLECEALGNDIGLAKRVVQVWFQNARAKEKKAKLSLAKQFGTESTCKERPKTECTLCSVKYSGCLSVRDHVFSSQHLAKVKEALGGQMDRDRECMDPTSVCQLMTPQGMDQLKRASEVLSGIQPQSAETSGGFAHSTPQYFNLSTASIPGIGSSPVASISSTKSDPSDASSSGLIGKHMPSSSSSMLATIDKDQVSTTNSVLTPKTSELASHLQFSKESNSENPTEKVERAPVGSATHSSSSSTNKEKQESFTPATTTPKPDKEYTMEAAQLLALQAAGATDQSALLQNSLLPCLIPGFPPIFPPQIPTALTGSFLQPMFGMEGMFPYSPVLPQALMGLSPGSILQQYQHNLQGALMHHRLQLQQKQLLQQPQKIKASQVSVPAHSQDLAYNKELVLDASKPEDVQGTKKLDDGFLMSQCIVSKGTCREREKDVCLYDCLACKISLSGNEELIQHLEDPLHRQRAAEQPNAKEHASRLLPHISPSSTSQPNPPSNQKSPPASQPKPSAPETSSANAFTHSTSASQCSPTPSTSTALTGVAQASCTPASPSLPVPLPSTLTSSLSGCHPKTTDSTNVCGDRAAEEQEST
ncbi:zinc finger homeobox protein 3 [Astyanax mexicanus]|uniref:zinc finger homeobox protein 3 n=1 Tax=Astyanax mexicanus TaxID=7994 RepID=UPI0020CB62D5|nr:zinc finger homeobox protein 3 [Astyanax mexicanus]